MTRDLARVYRYSTKHPSPERQAASFRAQLEDLRFAAYAIYGIGVLGSINVKRSVVAGQYHRPDGLYYGGAKLAASHALLVPKLREVATPASAAIMLDVHTGLGPTGVDTLIPSMTHDGATPECI